MGLIVNNDPIDGFYAPGQIYLPDFWGDKPSSDNKDALAKAVLKKSGGMFGTGQNGIIQEATSGGVLRLDLLEQAHNNQLPPEKQTQINAYSQLISDGLRFNKSITTNWLSGYGYSPESIPPLLKKEYEYNCARWTLNENAALARLQNPDIAVKEWIDELSLKFENLEEALVNPFKIREETETYVDPKLLIRMNDLGLFRLKIPKKFGGMGFNQREYDKVIRTITHTYSGTLAAIASAHSTLGSKPFEYFGDFMQKQYFLRKVSRGEGLVSFALTERGSGTDAINKAATIAKKEIKDGKVVYKLNGSKIYITNAQRSCIMLIFAKVDDGGPELKPTVFIKELPFKLTDTQEEINTKRKELEKEGLFISKPLELSGIRGSNQAYIEFHDFVIPETNEHGVSNILGEVGEGTQVIFNSLNAGRVGVGSSCSETAKQTFNMAVLEAVQRRRFDEHGGRLADLPQVKRYIAEMAIRTEALDATVELTTRLIDTYPNMNIIAECAAIKALSTEETYKVVIRATRVFGGQGLMKGFPIELILSDMWVPIIVEGVNEALKQHLIGVGAKPAMKISALGKLIWSRTEYPNGGLDQDNMLWLQNKTKSFSARALAMGLLNRQKIIFKQEELIALADEAIKIYQCAAVLFKLKSINNAICDLQSELLKSDFPLSQKLENENDLAKYQAKSKALTQFITNVKRKDEMIDGTSNAEHYPGPALCQVLRKVSPIKIKKKDLYPDDIADAYIKLAEHELAHQRNFESKIFQSNEGVIK